MQNDPATWREAIRGQRVKESVIQVSINPSPGIEPQISTAGKSVTLEQFIAAQERFLQNMLQSNVNQSLVKFSIKVLRYCLRKINYKSLIGDSNNDFDFKSRSKEKEYFRFLHLIVDLSAQKVNHFILFSPMFLRDVLYFMMHTDSEHTLHYHRCYDCNLLSPVLINMTRKGYFLEYFSIDQIIRVMEHLRKRKNELFVRFAPIIYLHCVVRASPS